MCATGCDKQVLPDYGNSFLLRTVQSPFHLFFSSPWRSISLQAILNYSLKEAEDLAIMARELLPPMRGVGGTGL